MTITLGEFKLSIQNILKGLSDNPTVSSLSDAHAKVYSLNLKTHLQLQSGQKQYQTVVDMCSELISEFGKTDERKRRMIQHILAPVLNQYVYLDRNENPNGHTPNTTKK